MKAYLLILLTLKIHIVFAQVILGVYFCCMALKLDHILCSLVHNQIKLVLNENIP